MKVGFIGIGQMGKHMSRRILEGGYDLDAAAACGQAAVAALLKRPWNDPLGPAPQPESSHWLVMERRAREIWVI